MPRAASAEASCSEVNWDIFFKADEMQIGDLQEMSQPSFIVERNPSFVYNSATGLVHNSIPKGTKGAQSRSLHCPQTPPPALLPAAPQSISIF